MSVPGRNASQRLPVKKSDLLHKTKVGCQGRDFTALYAYRFSAPAFFTPHTSLVVRSMCSCTHNARTFAFSEPSLTMCSSEHAVSTAAVTDKPSSSPNYKAWISPSARHAVMQLAELVVQNVVTTNLTYDLLACSRTRRTAHILLDLLDQLEESPTGVVLPCHSLKDQLPWFGCAIQF